MRCLVTAGPTFEPLDAVRRLTNFSTGRLGTELAAYLSDRGHSVRLLLGEQSTWAGDRHAADVELFSTTRDLESRLLAASGGSYQAVFHAAAVSDFFIGRIWRRDPAGALEEIRSGKLSTREGDLLAELKPTPKILPRLRHWFPGAVLVGWKYEVEGGTESLLGKAQQQILESGTDYCVVNGPAYGKGFGLVGRTGPLRPLDNREGLFGALAGLLAPGAAPPGERLPG